MDNADMVPTAEWFSLTVFLVSLLHSHRAQKAITNRRRHGSSLCMFVLFFVVIANSTLNHCAQCKTIKQKGTVLATSLRVFVAVPEQ
jgi:hypothetical protein